MSPEIKELSIVFVGNFNPVIINPYWLAQKNLIAEQVADTAAGNKDFITHPEVSQFSLGFCNVQALGERITFGSTQEGYFTHMRDLAMNIFGILAETPIKQIGINWSFHYKYPDEKRWHQFGHSILPKTIWEKVSTDPGLKHVEVRSKRDDGNAGEINIHAGWSDKIAPTSYGVRISVNDHYELSVSGEKVSDARVATDLLSKVWDASVTRAEKLAAEVTAYATA